MADITREYRTIVSGAGWIDRSRRGRIRFEGRDVLTFLQALVSNDVAALRPGQGVYATYLTPLGRMVTDLDLHVGDGWVMAGVAADTGAPLAARFDQLIFSEDVRVTDVTGTTGEIAVCGGRAAEVIGQALSVDASLLEGLSESSHLDWAGGVVARSGGASVPVFTIVTSADRLSLVIASLDAAGAIEISPELDDAMRIAAGRPLFGVDMTTETIPLEAGLLDRGISTTKGCYVGQEIVIRILHRGGGRVARRVVTLAIDHAAVLPSVGAVLTAGDRPAGTLTSVARSPMTGAPIALATVARDFAVVDQELHVGDVRAVVTGFAA